MIGRTTAGVLILVAVSSACGTANGGSDDAGSDGAGESGVDSGPVPEGGASDTAGNGDTSVPSCDAGSFSADEQILVNLPADSWYTVKGSSFLGAKVCANVGGVEGCAAIIDDWSGGVFDPVHDKMVIWGGGHDGYWGNEVYTFDPATFTWAMATMPSAADGNTPCADPLPDGNPVSRHTYDQIAYVTHANRMWSHGGAMAPCGFSTPLTWTLDFDAKKWTNMNPMGKVDPTSFGYYGGASAYDPGTKKVFLRTVEGFQSYDFDANTWTLLQDFGSAPLWPRYEVYGNKRGAIDTKRSLFWDVGGGDVFVWDIAMGKIVTGDWVTSGGGAYDNGDASAKGYPNEDFMTGGADVLDFDGPAFDYDAVADQFVAWVGGPADVLDLTSKKWTVKSGAGASPPPTSQRGVYGRFRYIARYNVFILVDGPNDDVAFYKNTAGCGSK
jgi:hypothetical protein